MRKDAVSWLFIALSGVALIVSGLFIKEKVEIKNAVKKVALTNNLDVEFLSEVKVSDFIPDLNGKIVDDYMIDTSELGKRTVDFTFINDENKKIPHSFEINIKDTVAPVVWLNDSYSVTQGSGVDPLDKILCGDNYDSHPKCEIIGDYDVDNIGSYPLVFKATDSSGNVTTKNFKLNVVAPSNNSNTNTNKTKTLFSDVVANYKTENTEIGLDISHHQGDVDFDALKEAGVEFVIIRVGTTKSNDSEYVLDSKFVQNITRANEVGIPVGIYFYSSSGTKEKAEADARWILEQIKDYKVDLPIAFDWEKWSIYNQYHLSFFGLTDMAKGYLDVFKEAGYEAMLYSSKNYLERIWLKTDYPIWLAHYTKNTNYQGDFLYWQLCSNGQVDGINGDVDIDIRYK